MDAAPGGEFFDVIFLGLIVGVLAILFVPQLRQRRWLLWAFVGGAVALFTLALIWTYTL